MNLNKEGTVAENATVAQLEQHPTVQMAQTGICLECKGAIKILIPEVNSANASEVYCPKCDRSTRIPKELVAGFKQLMTGRAPQPQRRPV
jgi:Zn finger protein HypA/HybF involved in hydrogenase expression